MRLEEAVFKFQWAEIAERAVLAAAVVEAFDVIEKQKAGLSAAGRRALAEGTRF